MRCFLADLQFSFFPGMLTELIEGSCSNSSFNILTQVVEKFHCTRWSLKILRILIVNNDKRDKKG